MNQKNLTIVLIAFMLVIISCTKSGSDLQSKNAIQLGQQFELVKGQTATLENNMKVTLVNVVEPSGQEARFVGLLNVNVESENKEPQNLQFEIESPTAERSYEVNGIRLNFEGYLNGVAKFSVTK